MSPLSSSFFLIGNLIGKNNKDISCRDSQVFLRGHLVLGESQGTPGDTDLVISPYTTVTCGMVSFFKGFSWRYMINSITKYVNLHEVYTPPKNDDGTYKMGPYPL